MRRKRRVRDVCVARKKIESSRSTIRVIESMETGAAFEDDVDVDSDHVLFFDDDKNEYNFRL